MDPTPFDALRPLLPAWVPWAPAILSLAACALTLIAARAAGWLALRPFLRLPPGAHWTERARLAWPARRIALLAATGFGVASLFLPWGGVLSALSPAHRAALFIPLQLAVAVAAALHVERRLFPSPAWRERLRSVAAWGTLLLPHLLVAVLFTTVVATAGRASAGGTAAAAAVVSWLALGGGFWIGRGLGLVLPAPARLMAALARAGEGSTLPPPRLIELPILSANAYALPTLRAIGVTSGALRALEDAELSAVLRHELAHLAEGRWIHLFRIVNVLVLPLAIVLGPLAFQSGPPWAGVALVWGALLLHLGSRRLQQRLEGRADEAAHAQAEDYARGLESLHRANLVPAVLGRRTSHPDLHDRLVAAGCTPTWDKPPPPPQRRGLGLAVGFAVVACIVAASSARVWLRPSHAGDVDALVRAAALFPEASDLAGLGRLRFAAGDLGSAAAFYRAAEALDPHDPTLPAVSALALSRSGRCADAMTALLRAVSLDGEDGYVADVRAEVEGCVPPPPGGAAPAR